MALDQLDDSLSFGEVADADHAANLEVHQGLVEWPETQSFLKFTNRIVQFVVCG